MPACSTIGTEAAARQLGFRSARAERSASLGAVAPYAARPTPSAQSDTLALPAVFAARLTWPGVGKAGMPLTLESQSWPLTQSASRPSAARRRVLSRIV